MPMKKKGMQALLSLGTMLCLADWAVAKPLPPAKKEPAPLNLAGAERSPKESFEQARKSRTTVLELIEELIDSLAESEKSHSEAMDLLNEAIEEYPNEALGYAKRAWGFYVLKQDILALRDLNRAIYLRRAPVYFLLKGNIYLMHGDFKKGIESYTTGLSLKPADPDVYYASRALGYHLSGQHQKALEDVAAALERNPAHIPAYLACAQIYLQQGHPGQAQWCYGRGISVRPITHASTLLWAISDLIAEAKPVKPGWWKGPSIEEGSFALAEAQVALYQSKEDLQKARKFESRLEESERVFARLQKLDEAGNKADAQKEYESFILSQRDTESRTIEAFMLENLRAPLEALRWKRDLRDYQRWAGLWVLKPIANRIERERSYRNVLGPLRSPLGWFALKSEKSGARWVVLEQGKEWAYAVSEKFEPAEKNGYRVRFQEKPAFLNLVGDETESALELAFVSVRPDAQVEIEINLGGHRFRYVRVDESFVDGKYSLGEWIAQRLVEGAYTSAEDGWISFVGDDMRTGIKLLPGSYRAVLDLGAAQMDCDALYLDSAWFEDHQSDV